MDGRTPKNETLSDEHSIEHSIERPIERSIEPSIEPSISKGRVDSHEREGVHGVLGGAVRTRTEMCTCEHDEPLHSSTDATYARTHARNAQDADAMQNVVASVVVITAC